MKENGNDSSSVEKTTEEQPTKKPLEKEISDLVGPFFEERKIDNAIVIAKMPDGKVAIFYNGHFYDTTVLLGEVYDQFRSKVAKQLR